MVVQTELLNLGLHPLDVQMGVVRLGEERLDEDQLRDLNTHLNTFGFELLDNSRTRLIDQIKNLIIERIYRSDDPEQKVNWSKLISDQVFHEYNYLSTLFH